MNFKPKEKIVYLQVTPKAFYIGPGAYSWPPSELLLNNATFYKALEDKVPSKLLHFG